MRISRNLTALLIGAVFSCSSPDQTTSGNSSEQGESTKLELDESTPEIVKEAKVERPKPIEWVGENPFYFVPVNAFEKKDEEKAIAWVEEQRTLGFKACYLWIPKFRSLSGTKKYAVGYGDFDNIEDCVIAIDSLKLAGQNSVYGLRVNEQGDRMEIRGKDKLKLNGLNVHPITEATPKVVLILDPAVDEEASEDWGWFTAEVQSACSEKGIYVEGAYENFKSIKVKQEEELIGEYDVTTYVENGIRGYVAIHGYERIFIQHDVTSGVLYKLSKFFGVEIPRVPIN